MFAAPPELPVSVHAVLPEAFRRDGKTSRWNRIKRGGAPCDSFLEGPSFDRDGNLFMVDVAFGRILRLDTEAEWRVFAEYDGVPNGLKIHKDGRIFVADHQHGIVVFDPKTAAREVVCGGLGYEGFKGVNDLVFARNGDLYFTDQGMSDLADPSGRLFCLRADGRLELILDGIPSPNGLVLTPDDKVLYLAVTKANCIWRVALSPTGGKPKVGLFIQLSGSQGGGPDGLALDESGNLAIATAYMGTVWVFDKFGEPALRLRCPAILPTNVAYGGVNNRTLYVTEASTGSVLSVQMPTAGQVMFSHL